MELPQGRSGKGLTWMGGRNAGKRAALEMHIAFTAKDARQAQLAVEDLHRGGVALLDGAGRRVEPSRRDGARFTYQRFDEEPRTIPCPDCDGAGCEHCGDGRRRV